MTNEEENRITYIARTDSRAKQVPFGIKRKDRARHTYIIGKTGMGKSTLLENMAIQDIRNGEGLAFVDPHGSSAERILEYVPEDRIKDVLYFAPFDMEHPVAFNVMEDVGYDKRHLVVSGLLSAFRKIWVDAWSARMEYILQNTLLALLEYPGSTLLSVNRMLIDKAYRKKVVDNIKDPVVRSFWVDEFATYTDRYTQEATPAIQNKIGQFTSNPLIRNIVGQAKSTFDLRQVMDEKKILIVNLSKGRVGEVNAALLGSMLVTKIYLSAMSRADATASALAKLPPFFFYVDEFQSFANESFADILSEARKYKLNLTIAHQYIEQMEEEVRDAVFGNVGTTIAFRVGPFDAEVLETIFHPRFTKEDLVNLGFAQVYLTLMIDGVGSPPFSALTLPPFEMPPQTFDARIVEESRRAYARPRAEVEEEIRRWQGESEEKAKQEKREREEAKETRAAPKPDKPFAPRAPEDRPRPLSPRPSGQGSERRPAPFSVPPREKPRQAPPLEGGASSLREAIARAQGGVKPSSPPERRDAAPRGVGHLKSAIASALGGAPKQTLPTFSPPPQRDSPRPAPPPKQNREQGGGGAAPKAASSSSRKNEIPEDVLRNMLKVDDES